MVQMQKHELTKRYSLCPTCRFNTSIASMCDASRASIASMGHASRASVCNRQTEQNKKLKEIEEELAKTNRMIRLATPALSLDAAQSKQAGTSPCFHLSPLDLSPLTRAKALTAGWRRGSDKRHGCAWMRLLHSIVGWVSCIRLSPLLARLLYFHS